MSDTIQSVCLKITLTVTQHQHKYYSRRETERMYLPSKIRSKQNSDISYMSAIKIFRCDSVKYMIYTQEKMQNLKTMQNFCIQRQSTINTSI